MRPKFSNTLTSFSFTSLCYQGVSISVITSTFSCQQYLKTIQVARRMIVNTLIMIVLYSALFKVRPFYIIALLSLPVCVRELKPHSPVPPRSASLLTQFVSSCPVEFSTLYICVCVFNFPFFTRIVCFSTLLQQRTKRPFCFS